MQKILKFVLTPDAIQTIDMAPGSQVLRILPVEDNGPCLFALCDIDQPRSHTRTFLLFGTNQEIEASVYPKVYIDTFVILAPEEKPLIVHVFEVTK